MKKYKINVIGCDDTTIFEVELAEHEYNLIKMICEKCTDTSQYGCQPTMSIEEIETPEP